MNENGYLRSAGGNGAILHLAVVFLGLVRKPLELSVTRSGRHCMLEEKKGNVAFTDVGIEGRP